MKLPKHISDASERARVRVVSISYGRHGKLIVERGGVTGKVFCSLSPSDIHAVRNIARDMERAVNGKEEN